MLKQVHDKFGDKPQVGRLFQSRDGNTLASFFNLKAATMGNQPLAGLVMITQHVVNDQRSARALTEDMRNQLINAALVPQQLPQKPPSGAHNPNGL